MSRPVALQPVDPIDIEGKDFQPFEGTLDAGETYVGGSIVATCTAVVGADADPQQVIWGAPVVDGTRILVPIRGRVPGVTYKIRLVAPTSSGRVLVAAALLACVEL